jgi:uncharacterized membrane protein
MADAARAFRKLGMTETRHRNAVLLYVSLRDRELACLGDEGIHAKVGDAAWRRVVDGVTRDFSNGDFYLGLHHALEDIGAMLASHFPSEGGDPENKLSNEISRS